MTNFATAETTAATTGDLAITGLNVSAGLLTRRSHALATFWAAAFEVRSPSDLVALQARYISDMAEDYQLALHATLEPLRRSWAPTVEAEAREDLRQAS